ncbi:helix-turn-helix domain-containing protein, partial [Micromonospora sp. PPF5-17]
MSPFPSPEPRPLGPLLAELRSALGWSQQRLAGALCAASGVPTLTRHEVSRWEHQRRLPGDFWLGWLAVVLGVPGALLADAAAHSRRLAAVPAAVDRAGARSRAALLALAHRWAADPSRAPLGAPLAAPAPPVPGGAAPDRGPAPTGAGPDGPAGDDLAELRRWDDLLGGADLAGHGARRLHRAVRGYRTAGPAARRRLLPELAGSAQLAGWLAADAGEVTAALDAYRLALRAAAADADPAFAGHVLGSASHLLAGVGDPAGALALAGAGYAGCRDVASPGLRALLLHRLAFAAALAGRSRAARRALDAAGRAGDPAPGREPPWLYWLDPPELAA